MKKLLCFLLLIANSTVAQDARKLIQVIETNDSLTKEIIQHSDKEYHLLIMYVDWCKPCRDSLPVLLKLLSDFPDVEPHFIYVDKLSYINLLKKYLVSYPEIEQSYILDGSYEGNARFLLIEPATGKFWEIHGSHCSCYGFEGQFVPSECPIEYLAKGKQWEEAYETVLEVVKYFEKNPVN